MQHVYWLKWNTIAEDFKITDQILVELEFY